MSSAFERMQKLAEAKKKQQQVVDHTESDSVNQDSQLPVDQVTPSMVNHISSDVVLQTSPSTVNQSKEKRSTELEKAVNNPTTPTENVYLFTTETNQGGKQDDKSTTNEHVVNQSKRNWSTIERKRGKYGATVESFRTSEDFKRKVNVFCAEHGIDKQDFYRLAVNHYFDTVVNHKQGEVVNLSTDDDRRMMIMFKSKPFIINLYLHYNSIFNELANREGKEWRARWTPRDDEIAVRYNDISPTIVELGILQTQIQKGFGTSRIQTFRYYTDEIEKVLASGVTDEMLQTILMYHRNIWKNQTGREVDLKFLEDLTD